MRCAAERAASSAAHTLSSCARRSATTPSAWRRAPRSNSSSAVVLHRANATSGAGHLRSPLQLSAPGRSALPRLHNHWGRLLAVKSQCLTSTAGVHATGESQIAQRT